LQTTEAYLEEVSEETDIDVETIKNIIAYFNIEVE